MVKDGPPSGGMRFGFKAHRDAGLPFVQSSTGRSNLQVFLKKFPDRRDLASEVEARLKRGEAPSDILYALREAGHEGAHCMQFWRNEHFSGQPAETRYSDDLHALKTWVAELLSLGFCKSWSRWQRNSATGAWLEVEWFPTDEYGA